MTISTTTANQSFTADGILTQFSFTYRALADSDIAVYLDGVVQVSGFTVTLNADQDASPGGDVDFSVAPDDQVIVNAVREVPYTQATDYEPYTTFPAASHETALDKLTMLVQQIKEILGRTPSLGVDTTLTDFSLGSPQADEVVIYNTDEDGIEASGYTLTALAADVEAADASATAAAAAETGAETAETNAETAETNAEASETAAAASAAAAAASAVIAATPGVMADWPTDTPPSGWLERDGSSLSRTTYAALFAVIGVTYGNVDGSTFNLPDHRGEFPRYFDNGAGVDPDAASRTDRGDGTTGDEVGTKQDFAIENFVGEVSGLGAQGIYINDGTGIMRTKNTTTRGPTDSGGGSVYENGITLDASRDIQTSTETRPVNSAVMGIIRY